MVFGDKVKRNFPSASKWQSDRREARNIKERSIWQGYMKLKYERVQNIKQSDGEK